MNQIVKLELKHLEDLVNDDLMVNIRAGLFEDTLINLSKSKYAFTLLKDGIPVACMGITEYWTGRGEAWAMFIPGNSEVFTRVFRACKKFLNSVNLRRIEATVRTDFLNGHRFAMMLGFECERYEMKGYGPTGESYSAYSYIKGVE